VLGDAEDLALGRRFFASGVLRPRWWRILRMAKASVRKATMLMRWPQRVQRSGSTS
jgi:hypothetical protein